MVHDGPDRDNRDAERPMNGLLRHHLEDLRRSGLSDETIEACRFGSVAEPAEACRLLCWKQRSVVRRARHLRRSSPPVRKEGAHAS